MVVDGGGHQVPLPMIECGNNRRRPAKNSNHEERHHDPFIPAHQSPPTTAAAAAAAAATLRWHGDDFEQVTGLFRCAALCWSARVVKCGVHLLEREGRYGDALHYLVILLQCQRQRAAPGSSFCWLGEVGSVWLRYAIDLGHVGQHELALQTYELALADTTSVAGQWRVAMARGLAKLWKPPRRWGRSAPVPIFQTAPVLQLKARRCERSHASLAVNSPGGGGRGWLPMQWATSVGDFTCVRQSIKEACRHNHHGKSKSRSCDATWVRRESDDASSGFIESVEGLVLRHYEAAGWRGCHGENRFVALSCCRPTNRRLSY